MQGKLAKWSTDDKSRKFGRLLRLIASTKWLKEAAKRTLQSSGSKTPGIDGIDRKLFVGNLEANLEAIRNELLSGSYSPLPARRIYIPKANGKQRPLGIPTLRDRVVQRAMLMVMEPIWESDFHRDSYGFRPHRSVHHAIRAVKLQLQDSSTEETHGRWIIEGDLTSYFDTVHHKLLMKCVRQRIADQRFLNVLWQLLKAGCIDRGLFRASHEGVPQGGVLSPLLSNIMLNEFDRWMEKNHIGKKARKDRWYWNFSLKRPIATREGRSWIPGIAYCRYADDFVVIVKGSKKQAEGIREKLRQFLEGILKLKLNLEKTALTHVNDGFTFLGHRLIRKRGPKGTMRVVSQIPTAKFQAFAAKMIKELSGNYGANKILMFEKINRQIRGWANFYQFTDYVAIMFEKMDQIIFWKIGYWLAMKYRVSMRELMKKWIDYPKSGDGAKTWRVYGPGRTGRGCSAELVRMSGHGKKQFRWTTPMINPYVAPIQDKWKIYESRYPDVAMALSQS
jgi:group II intron reverse transcriptase/maturase